MKKHRKDKKLSEEQKQVSFRRLTFEALPEMWGFKTLTAIFLFVPATVLSKLITWTAESAGTAMTTANIKEMLLSWRAVALLILGGALIIWYVIMEIFAQIHMHADILNGRRTSILQDIGKGIRSFRRFLSPTGILILLYIFIAAPLCGIGEFSISLSRTFYIPNFIMDVIKATPLYIIAYIALILGLLWIGIRYIFSVHAMLIDGMSPPEARKESRRILKAHGMEFILGMLKHIFFTLLVLFAAIFLFYLLPYTVLTYMGRDLPTGYNADIVQIAESAAMSGTDITAGADIVDETTASIIGYRIFCCLCVLMGGYLISVALLLCNSYVMLRFTRYYLEFTRGTCSSWLERPKKSHYSLKVLFMVGVSALFFLASGIMGVFYHQFLVRPEPVRIIAHRAGGTQASENSIEGLYAAMEHGCYASEIDVQRTKDGYYIINHDNDFKRLTGIARAPQDMTLEEIKTLRIKDTTGSGAELPVVTLEEMLDVTKGRIKLFIELKGKSADRQMVDDLVRMIRERDCVQDVALISLDYDVIDYAETNYPEFETGVLFFAGIGNVARLNCDLLIMEEETATDARVDQVHSAGKQAIVWTVNTSASMYRFLDSNIDAVITDEIVLAEETQARLDARGDLEVIHDKLFDIGE